jgi:hypothetical protein
MGGGSGGGSAGTSGMVYLDRLTPKSSPTKAVEADGGGGGEKRMPRAYGRSSADGGAAAAAAAAAATALVTTPTGGDEYDLLHSRIQGAEWGTDKVRRGPGGGGGNVGLVGGGGVFVGEGLVGGGGTRAWWGVGGVCGLVCIRCGVRWGEVEGGKEFSCSCAAVPYACKWR